MILAFYLPLLLREFFDLLEDVETDFEDVGGGVFGVAHDVAVLRDAVVAGREGAHRCVRFDLVPVCGAGVIGAGGVIDAAVLHGDADGALEGDGVFDVEAAKISR